MAPLPSHNKAPRSPLREESKNNTVSSAPTVNNHEEETLVSRAPLQGGAEHAALPSSNRTINHTLRRAPYQPYLINFPNARREYMARGAAEWHHFAERAVYDHPWAAGDDDTSEAQAAENITHCEDTRIDHDSETMDDLMHRVTAWGSVIPIEVHHHNFRPRFLQRDANDRILEVFDVIHPSASDSRTTPAGVLLPPIGPAPGPGARSYENEPSKAPGSSMTPIYFNEPLQVPHIPSFQLCVLGRQYATDGPGKMNRSATTPDHNNAQFSTKQSIVLASLGTMPMFPHQSLSALGNVRRDGFTLGKSAGEHHLPQIAHAMRQHFPVERTPSRQESQLDDKFPSCASSFNNPALPSGAVASPPLETAMLNTDHAHDILPGLPSQPSEYESKSSTVSATRLGTSSTVNSAETGETQENQYTGESQAPRDLDPPERLRERVRGATEWHEWIMTNSWPRPSRPTVERQIFNSLMPTPADTLVQNPLPDPLTVQQLLQIRANRLLDPCQICEGEIKEAAEAPCGHLFCTKCAIGSVFGNGEYCPMCGADMCVTDLVRVRIKYGEEPEFLFQKRGRLG